MLNLHQLINQNALIDLDIVYIILSSILIGTNLTILNKYFSVVALLTWNWSQPNSYAELRWKKKRKVYDLRSPSIRSALLTQKLWELWDFGTNNKIPVVTVIPLCYRGITGKKKKKSFPVLSWSGFVCFFVFFVLFFSCLPFSADVILCGWRGSKHQLTNPSPSLPPPPTPGLYIFHFLFTGSTVS